MLSNYSTIYFVRLHKSLTYSLLALLIFLSSCSSNDKPNMQPPPVPVTVFTVEPQSIPAVLEYVGVAQSSHLVEIRARVEGYLEKIAYTEGALVKEGDLLFVLDQKPFLAKLDSAKAELAKQEAVLTNANRALDRLKPLFEKNAASRKDLDDAEATKLVAESDVEVAKSNVTTAELNLSYTVITAPITAYAGQSNFREGALITPGSNTLLTTLSVLDPIWVTFSVSESDILKYTEESKKGRIKFPKGLNFTVEITLSDGSKFPELGKVNFTDPMLNQATGTMSVRATFKNPKSLLKPGQFVRAQILGSTWERAIVVPQRALQESRSGMFVYVVDNENKAAIRLVAPGEWVNEYWIIKTGLRKGDRVIVDGVNKVQSGSLVNVTKEIKYQQPDKNEPTKMKVPGLG